MNATWKDFVKQSATPESMPQSRTGFDRISDRIGGWLKPIAKRFIGEMIPGGAYIPSVRRQMEADQQARFDEWYSKLKPETQRRFYETFFQPGLWNERQLEARRAEFDDMPGGKMDQIKNMAMMVASMPGRIKAYRPMLAKLPGNASGATVKAIRKRGLGPKHDVGEVQGLVRDDLREIEDMLGYNIDSAEMADSVFARRNIVKDLDVLGELDPALKKKVVNNLRNAKPISRYRRYVHDDKYVNPRWKKDGPEYVRRGMEENNPFRTEHIPDKKEVLQKYNQLVGDRVRNSLAYQRMNRRIAARIPIEMQNGNVSPFSIFKIKQWLMSEADRSRFRGIKHRRAIDLAERTRISVDPNSNRDLATTSPEYGSVPKITLSVLKDNKGGYYVNKDALRHEFGHVLDHHGTEEAGELFRMLRSISPIGTINGEIRANRIGGLPRITPWTDTYYAASKDPKLVLEAWKRYRHIKKPNLPQ